MYIQMLLEGSSLNRTIERKTSQTINYKTFVPIQLYWTETQQQSFDELRRVLLEEVSLTHPDFILPFTLDIDASRGALGTVLSQETGGKLCPLAFANQKLMQRNQITQTSLEIACIEVGSKKQVQGLSTVCTIQRIN